MKDLSLHATELFCAKSFFPCLPQPISHSLLHSNSN